MKIIGFVPSGKMEADKIASNIKDHTVKVYQKWLSDPNKYDLVRVLDQSEIKTILLTN